MIEEKNDAKIETKVEKWSRECFENGFKFIRKVDGDNSLAECQDCGHQDVYQQVNMRKGKVACSGCPNVNIPKWTNECLAQGFKFIRKVDKHNSLAECTTCGHQDVYRQGDMRRGKVRCENCLVNKYKSFVKHGWEYVDKSRIENNYYVILKHKCSENLVTVRSCSLLKGSYDCPNCMHSHFDEQSFFYVIKVTHNNHSMIKIGVANNTDRRFKQYGLPDDAKVEIIRIEPFPTKRLAITFESAMKQALKEYKVDSVIAKEIFKCEGHTECFTDESLEYLENFFNTDSE